MKFKQLSTGVVLETDNEAVIAMMTASDAYTAVPLQNAKSSKGDKGSKGAFKGSKPAEDSKLAE